MGLSIITTPRELWKFGTHERDTRRTPLYLSCVITGNTVNVLYSTFRKMGAAAGYAVTAGKTLLLTRLLYRSSSTGQYFSVGYSDSDLGQSNQADGANPISFDVEISAGEGIWASSAQETLVDIPIYYEVPAGKFPRCVAEATPGNWGISAWGHEV